MNSAYKIFELIISMLFPIIFAFAFVLAKKAIQVLERKLDIYISAREWELIDSLVEEAVRSVEENSRKIGMSSIDKEELALLRIRQACDGRLEKICEEKILRTKIQACVNKLYNHERLRDGSCA